MRRGTMLGTLRSRRVLFPACAASRLASFRRPPMRRSLPLVICICLCALATGMTLIALTREVSRTPISGHHRSGEITAANVDLVRRFYADVAGILATGDVALLDRDIASDLVEHPARPGVASGRDGIVRALLSLRATFPDLTLIVDDVRSAGTDQVVARVHTEGTESGVFLGRPAPASAAQWGPLEVWRIAGGQIVEHWGDPAATVLVPLGEVPIPIETLGSGHRRLTETRMTVEPEATMAVNNGQAIRFFAVAVGVLTIDVAIRSGATVSVARESATPIASRPDRVITAMTGDIVVTTPEADYTITNDGPTPAVVIVVSLSNKPSGEWPLNSSSLAASWTVAAMPQALGGASPSPVGFSAYVLASNVEIAIPDRPILALGWMFLNSRAAFVLPGGDGTLLAAIDEGWAEMATVVNTPKTTLPSRRWAVIPIGVEGVFQDRGESPAVIRIFAVIQELPSR